MKSIVASVLLLFGSCQSTWDTYDISSHQTIGAPGPESYEAHVALLERMVEVAPPPPGLCAELAYFLVLLGRPDQAEAWFAKEMHAWPGSEKFVLGLRRSLGLVGPLVTQPVSLEVTK